MKPAPFVRHVLHTLEEALAIPTKVALSAVAVPRGQVSELKVGA